MRAWWLQLFYSNAELAHGFGVARSCIAKSVAVPPSASKAQFEPGYSEPWQRHPSRLQQLPGSNGCEGTDGEEPESAEPEPPKPASTETATAECAICLDDDAVADGRVRSYTMWAPLSMRQLHQSAVSDCPVCRGAMTAVLRVFI